MPRSYRPQDLHAAGQTNPLVLAAHGYFWTGIEQVETSVGPALRGQTYVEYFVPQELRHPLPIVMVHGGGGQGLDYLGTADGREGWAHWFVRAGYAVYVIDRPQHGRAPFHPEAQGAMAPFAPPAFLEQWFSQPELYGHYPQARLHDKWPGGGKLGDPEFDHFHAESGPSLADSERHYRDCQRGGAELLDRIGPAIVMTHSAGGPVGWLVADARPGLVRAIVAVEPVGPPFSDRPGVQLRWGISPAPLMFDPPIGSPDELTRAVRPAPREDTVACLVQAEPARRLPNLCGFPIVVVTAEASWMATDNHGMVDFLAQAGANVEHLRLEEHGVHGNAHALMLEVNSDAIAAVIEGWIAKKALR
jgi:pimeloyl-ACP methyl ester carboxylesterase